MEPDLAAALADITADLKGLSEAVASLTAASASLRTRIEALEPLAGPRPAPRPLLGIRGKKGAGKDTLAGLATTYFPEYETQKWAAKLREAAALITDIPAEDTAGDAGKEVDLESRHFYTPRALLDRIQNAIEYVRGGPQPGDAALAGQMYAVLVGRDPPLGDSLSMISLPMTVGRLLQLLGTECFRDLVGPDVWVEALMRPWAAGGCPPTIVADTRFPNESAAIRGAGGVVILVRRAAAARADGRADGHASECALDDEPADIVLDNEGSVADLRAALFAAWPAILAVAERRRDYPAYAEQFGIVAFGPSLGRSEAESKVVLVRVSCQGAHETGRFRSSVARFGLDPRGVYNNYLQIIAPGRACLRYSSVSFAGP